MLAPFGPSGGERVHLRNLLQLGLALCVSLGLACATTAPPPADTGELFLWEVARPDGSGGIAHLLGSVHMAEDELTLDPAIDRALADADTLVLEIDPQQLDPAQVARLAVEEGTFSDGRTLEQVLTPATFLALAERLTGEGLPVATFQAFQPWYALLTLQMLALHREGYDVGQGVETSLTLSAAESGKPTQGLETVEQQLDVMSGLPLDLQVRQLEEFLRDEGSDGGDISSLIDAWHRGDAALLEHEVFGELERDPSLLPYYERFYFDRNDRMAQGIATRVDSGGRWFVAVGAAHVVGARGVPSLLARHGYRVRRLPKTLH
jgi:uncharacterized protein YbaP (TraB family)